MSSDLRSVDDLKTTMASRLLLSAQSISQSGQQGP